MQRTRQLLPLSRPATWRSVSAGRYASTRSRQDSRTTEDDGGDFRPPWVYSGSRFLTYTTIPLTLLYCALLADWGEREHIFMPLRRWVSNYRQSILSLSPEEAALVRECNGQSPPADTCTQRKVGSSMSQTSASSIYAMVSTLEYIHKLCFEKLCSCTGTMQTASPTFLLHSPQNGYQPLSGGHSYVSTRSKSSMGLIRGKNVSEAEIYAIKRQYLGLLPPQQVIDICLTFEAHAPLHVKSSVWPYDIRVAIASIQAQKAQPSQNQISPESNTPSQTSVPDDGSSGEQTAQPQPSSTHQATPAPTQAGSPASTPPAASQSAIPGPHHPPYCHPTYPHPPYYTSSHPPYGYPHPYASYPPPPAVYPTSHLSFSNTSLIHPLQPGSEAPPPLSGDDLPSYEEMIVEALLDSGDPEGCAPKSLFSWMAMHYPLQTNFRPSASQALQKAYKRGRLEKGSNGKYRLNENWEGGNTSKRTTRRPQTLARTAMSGPQPSSSSPFTHAPLVPHGASNLQARLPPPGQPPGYGGYPFGYPYHGTSVSAPLPAPRGSSGATPQKQVASGIEYETGEGGDAWEAAQNILKAINFGQLFQISNEENKAGELSTHGGSPNRQATADRAGRSLLASDVTVPEGHAGYGAGRSAELDAEQRATLQAQLALLAAQLAELADVSEDELSQNLEVLQRIVVMSNMPTPQVVGEGDDNVDMVEMPVASLAARV